MISGLFLYNHLGDILLSKIYRNDINEYSSKLFRVNVIHARHSTSSPINNISKTTFIHMKRNNLWLCAVTKQNVNAAMVFELLRKIVDIMEISFKINNEKSVTNNFVMLYEFFDEIVDFGYPQNTDIGTLKFLLSMAQKVSTAKTKQTCSEITSQATGRIVWRKKGIKYRRNELYLDVFETINLLMSPQGSVLCVHAAGRVVMKSSLSGMPECKLGINDAVTIKSNNALDEEVKDDKPTVTLDDCAFHQCVKLNRYESDRCIYFIPPDGKFELMRYRTTNDILLPFRVIPLIRNIGKLELEIKVVLKSNFKSTSYGQEIELLIPTPPILHSVQVSTSKGSAKYKSSDDVILWKIDLIKGTKEAQICAKVTLLSSNEKKWARPPISMKFMLSFAPSGFRIRYLKVFEQKMKYEATKWVRYIGRNGLYETRC